MLVPTTLKVTFAAKGTTLTGVKTVYFLALLGGVTLAADRVDFSLACVLSTDPIYCVLKPAGTYYGVTMTTPFIMVRDALDVLVAPSTDLYIYNVKEF